MGCHSILNRLTIVNKFSFKIVKRLKITLKLHLHFNHGTPSQLIVRLELPPTSRLEGVPLSGAQIPSYYPVSHAILRGWSYIFSWSDFKPLYLTHAMIRPMSELGPSKWLIASNGLIAKLDKGPLRETNLTPKVYKESIYLCTIFTKIWLSKIIDK